MSRRILVADDSSTIQKVIKIALSRHTLDIVEAGTYVEALTASQRTQPSMLILDASLPGARGPADFAKLAQEAHGAPILLLVGTYDSVDEGAFRQAGFQNFLKKPFESGDIVAQVDSLLGDGENTAGRGGAPVTSPGERAQHNAVVYEGGYQTLSGFDPTRPPPPPESALDLGDDLPPPRGFIPPPPPMTEQGRKGRRAFDGEGEGTGRAPGGVTNVPPPPLSMSGAMDDDTTMSRRTAPDRLPSPLPPIPPGAGLGASSGISLSLEEDEGFKPQPQARNRMTEQTQAPSGDWAGRELPTWVRQAVEDYCDRHFKSLARDIIATELRRLADEKARHLVDN